MRLFQSLLTALILVSIPGLAAEPQVTLEEAWVRALPPTQPNTAAYLTIVNSGHDAVEIVSARADIAQSVEFHTTREVDGLVRMEQLPTLRVASGRSLELAPGGAHLMLLGLSKMPQPGDSVQICFAQKDGQETCTEAPVRKSAGEDKHQHHHH